MGGLTQAWLSLAPRNIDSAAPKRGFFQGLRQVFRTFHTLASLRSSQVPLVEEGLRPQAVPMRSSMGPKRESFMKEEGSA